MIDITCKDLINIFSKIGGKLTINYNKITCTYDDHITREFKNYDDWHELDKILFEYAPFYHDISNEIKSNNEIKKYHHFQDRTVSEITLQTRRDNDGYLTFIIQADRR